MGRVEENKNVIKNLDKYLNDEDIVNAWKISPEFMKCGYFFSIGIFLEDISKSLAVIADCMQQGEKDGGDS